MAISLPINPGYNYKVGTTTGSNKQYITTWLEYKVKDFDGSTAHVHVILYSSSNKELGTGCAAKFPFGYLKCLPSQFDSQTVQYCYAMSGSTYGYSFALDNVNKFGEYEYVVSYNDTELDGVELYGEFKTTATVPPTSYDTDAESYNNLTPSQWISGGNVTANLILKTGTVVLSFNANGGSGAPGSMSGTVYMRGGAYAFKLPTTKPTRSGYTFNGWGTSASATSGYAAGATITVTSDTTLYAVWTKLNTYEVSYNANGGSTTPSTQYKTHDVALTLASKIERAKSVSTVTTTLNANGGSVSPASVDSTVTTEYAFDNWKATNGATYAAGGSYTANEATTMTAQWTQSVSGESINLPVPSRPGYTFDGWYTAAWLGKLVTSYAPTTNSTLYAQWTANTYSISYDANGGYGAPATQTYTYAESGTTNLSSTIPTRTGYTFLGWALTNNATAASYSPGQAWKLNNIGNYTLYAVWEANQYTYNTISKSDSGLVLGRGTLTYPFGDTVGIKPHDRNGYVTPDSQTVKWDSTTPKDIVFIYTRIHYDILYDAAGGELPSGYPESYTVEDRVILPVPARYGYKFIGWLDSTGEQTSIINAGSTGAKSFTAQWKAEAILYTKVDGSYRRGLSYVKAGGKWKTGKQIFQKYNGHWGQPHHVVVINEDFQTFATPDTVVTNTPTVGAYWNGIATPQWNGVPQNGFGTLMVHENEGYNGSKCISASIRGTADAKSRMTIHYRLFDKLTAGATYVLKLKIKKSADLDTDVQVQAQYREESGNPFFKVSDKVTTEWQEFSFEFVPDGTMKDFILAIGTGKGTKGTVYFDDVSLKMLGSGVELIKDGNFETFQEYRATPKKCTSGSTVPWNGIPSKYWSGVRSSGSGSMTVLGEQGVDGGKCLCIAIEAPEKSVSRLSAQYNHGKPLVVGQRYVLKMKVKKSADCDADIAFQTQYKSESGNPTTAITKDVGIEWTQIVREFTPEGTMKDFLLMLRVGNSGLRQQGEVYFDDISLTLKDDPTELMHDGGFEDCSPYDSVLRESSVETVTYWNGATPPDGWSVRCKEGAVTLQPCIEDDNVSLKATIDSFARPYLHYRLPATLYAMLRDGVKYTVRVNFKCNDGYPFDVYVETACKSHGSEYSVYTINDTWKAVAHTFTFSSEAGTLDIYLGFSSLKLTKVELQIDNLRLQQ